MTNKLRSLYHMSYTYREQRSTIAISKHFHCITYFTRMRSKWDNTTIKTPNAVLIEAPHYFRPAWTTYSIACTMIITGSYKYRPHPESALPLGKTIIIYSTNGEGCIKYIQRVVLKLTALGVEKIQQPTPRTIAKISGIAASGSGCGVRIRRTDVPAAIQKAIRTYGRSVYRIHPHANCDHLHSRDEEKSGTYEGRGRLVRKPPTGVV